MPFSLRAVLSDGFTVSLEGEHRSQAHAERAAEQYIRHYSDPCGLGVTVNRVEIIDNDLLVAG